MKTNPNDDAFACPGGQQGLTKREYFAAAALACVDYDDTNSDKVAKRAVLIADKLINQLNREEQA